VYVNLSEENAVSKRRADLMSKEENRFYIGLPPGWEDQTVYYFMGPEIDGKEHQLMMTISRYLQHDNVADFASEKTRPFIDSLQGVEVLKDEETTVPGCYPSYDFVYKWIPADGLKVIKKCIFVLHGSFGFSFEIEFSKKSYKMLGGQVKKLIEGLLPGTYEPLED
jgi:hypothetical protein